MVAPDDTTLEYMAGRPYTPRGEAWDRALATWRALPGDDGAGFDKTVTLDAAALEPMVTYNNPGMGLPISRRVPDPERAGDPAAPPGPGQGAHLHGPAPRRAAAGPAGGRGLHRLLHQLAHLRPAPERPRCCAASAVGPGVRVLVVPGSQDVKRQAEAEGWPRCSRPPGPSGARPAAR